MTGLPRPSSMMEQVAERLLRDLEDVSVGKVFPRGPDSERYTVALASVAAAARHFPGGSR